MSLVDSAVNLYFLFIEMQMEPARTSRSTATNLRRSPMKFLFKRDNTTNNSREIRRRVESRRETVSPFGAPLNALKPLID